MFGNTEPDELVNPDVDLMKRAGANFSRIAHNPQAPNLLRRLDEKGMLLILEIPIWGDDPLAVPDNPLTWLVRRASVRPWHEHRGLTVFLVELPEVEDETLYLSLDEALESGALTITEKEGGRVPVLLARNKGTRPVLMLAGEILVGGKQNRALRHSVLLPPKSGAVQLPVYCVEQGRWSAGDAPFRSRSSVAAHSVRAAAVAQAPQSEVWEGVAMSRQNLGVADATTDLQRVQDDATVRANLADYMPDQEANERPRSLGMVVARHGQIIGADIFCNPEVFAKHRDRLLESYALDCLAADRHEDIRFERPGAEDAEKFLRRVMRAEFTWRDAPGEGRLLDAVAPGCRATALVREGTALHAAFVARQERPSPPDRPMPIRPMPRRQRPGIQ